MKKTDIITKRDEYVLKELENGKKITVRDMQLEVLPIMDEIHRICVKNKIPYGLMAGSALGICNYKGFIPWDDDMDIIILREDWNRFVEAMKKDLNTEEFYFQCYQTDKKYNVIMGPNMKIRKRGSYIQEKNFLLRNKCKSGDGVFVDAIIYDHIAENKAIDELNRTVIRLVMPFYILFDNIGINPLPLKKFIWWFSKRYSKKHQNSKYLSEPISVPWSKPFHEPIFLKEDVLPFELYDFEGRKFYSYHNLEKVMKEWYGPNCLKKWNGTEWEETLPIEKRKPKHVVDINLDGDQKLS